MKTRVIFAFPRWRQGQGSVVPRVEQMAQILTEFHGHAYAVEKIPLARPRFHDRHEEFIRHAEGAIVIGLQNSLRLIGQDRFLSMRDRVAGLCMDHVDSVPNDDEVQAYHVHILASHIGSQRVSARLARNGVVGSVVTHVTHHADTRITKPVRGASQPFQIGYLGNPKKMIAPPESDKVSILSYEDQKGFETALETLKSFPMQYGVRPRSVNREVSKPFTKGFTAAAMGANLLVNRQTDDATYYLGTDYPYLIPSTKPHDIAGGIAHAKETYGGAEWTRGLEIMEHVRYLSTPRLVAGEMAAAIELARAVADGTRR